MFFDNSFSNTFWYESAINWWRVIANTAVKRRACAGRSILTGHALISRAKLQPRSRKLCTEILKRSKKFVQGNKNKAKDNSRLFAHKTHLITVSCSFTIAGFMFIYHFVLSFTKKVIRFLNTVTYWFVWLLTTRVRLLGSNTITARGLVITKFPHVQTFECYIIIVTPSEWARNTLSDFPKVCWY